MGPGAGSALAAAVAGRVVLDPRDAQPIRGGRPMIGAEVLRRMTEGRRASMLPDLLGAMFSVCGAVHRLTARHAVAAALGMTATGDATGDEPSEASLLLRAATLRDHLHRLALDLPARVPVGIDAATTWLAGAPMVGVPASPSARTDELAAGLQRMVGWLERELLGCPPEAWWREWQQDPARTAGRWATRQVHPVARWHAAVRERAESLRLPCRPLALLEAEPAVVRASMRELARELAEDAGFSARPLWLGLPAETGAWTRDAALRIGPLAAGAGTAWLRLAARVADSARVVCDAEALRHGCLALGGGEGIAWSEMARGLLVHWVRLEADTDDPALARVETCRVLAPTEWNFHADGGLAQWLRSGAPGAADVALAAAALDPCVEFEVVGAERDAVPQACEVGHA
ncbi:MAG: hydrogenase formation protein [Pseudomonadota bacterium]